MVPSGLPVDIGDHAVRHRALAHLRQRGVRLPTFSEIADPATVPKAVAGQVGHVGFDEPDPLNLYRVHWFNDWDKVRIGRTPVSIEIPSALSGVEARIVVAVGSLFPMIGAHKVLAAYACLAPRLVTGRFDPTRQRAVWPSTGNYCRGGVAISRILGCRAMVVLPSGMSQERFDWLTGWVSAESDIIKTPGSESNVKEIYDKCAELRRDPSNEIVNQFSEFANYLGHWRCTGPALEAIFQGLQHKHKNLNLKAFVCASGSAGTLAAGDYLKERQGTKIAVVEAVECPTLLMNGYGEHNIQGIGDKHVPLIHNVMNTDVVIGVSDRATDGLNAVFNTEAGRDYLSSRCNLDPLFVRALSLFGLSSIANIVASIKFAKHFGLSSNDAIVTVATDGAQLYGSEMRQYLARRHNRSELSREMAAEIVAAHLGAADSDHVLEVNRKERERIFNLGYFTWVEQQGVNKADFDRRKRVEFWRALQDVVPLWDALIAQFNVDSGMARARAY
jgi:cysteine synthase